MAVVDNEKKLQLPMTPMSVVKDTNCQLRLFGHSSCPFVDNEKVCA